jgi:hypothetical protein
MVSELRKSINRNDHFTLAQKRVLKSVEDAVVVVEEGLVAVEEGLAALEGELVVLPYSLAAGDETTPITTGVGKAEFQIVHGAFELVAIYATLTTAGTGSTITIDVNLDGTSIMATNKITIDATEKTSDTAAIQPTLTTTTLTENGVVTVDFDAVDSGGVGAGPKIYLVGYWV